MKKTLKTMLLVTSSLAFIGGANATPPGFNEPSMGQVPMRAHGDEKPKSVNYWWPDRVDLSELRKNAYSGDPIGNGFDYAKAFSQLDLEAVKADITAVLSDSQDWWPADYGTYAGFFIRMTWHAAGTYRSGDGRGGADGGQQRFEPLNSWPDNASLDKARRLLWPVKQKYGHSLSWADLIVLAGNVALESAGFKTYGFSGGRLDDWEPELVYWGPESKFLESERHADGSLNNPLAASEMGLIYVNPEGPHGNPDILAAAEAIRTTFGRMGMNDEETAALIVGGHTLGKAHGAHKASECIGAEPAAAGVEEQGLGWKNKCGTGSGPDAVTSGLEGAWTASPQVWSNNYVENLYAFEWTLTTSPAGAKQWVPEDEDARFVPDAFDPDKLHQPIMFTTDLAMRYDPEYGKITKRFLEVEGAMDDAFARAWFKLTHRDMGPKSRYVGLEVPADEFVWQDPLPEVDGETIGSRDTRKLKDAIRKSGIASADLVRAAWGSASTFRDTDYRGGANGGRIRLAPQKDWEVNDPASLERVLAALEEIQADFNKGRRKVSLADLIVLGGAVAIEDAAEKAGVDITVPFVPGRADAGQQHTDAKSFNYLQPAADGFRNYMSDLARRSPSEMLIDKADTLTLTVPEMSVLIAGMRALDANAGGARHGVLTDRPGALSNDFFVNLLDMSTAWKKSETAEGVFEGVDRQSGALKWTATEVDLVFGSNSELRAVAEYYAYANSQETFVKDFVKAWTKVMTLDRFEM
ncbi:catalase/peroxidase HPI [Eilatimonas milleporae]|uniref:Catalase-peroxidase n=1 Tax=Eilatimonas milleporae TaxID=911205 RepID=A0A3M0CXZ9_9PROT|nr:catalase/peroxidase HPI [Eilatimonas milleporae]RMB08873.1 catalase-peroxidase [Eilatimonas milleporae]